MALLGVVAPALHAAPEIQVVLTSDKEYYQETASFLRESFLKTHPSGKLITTTADRDDWPSANSQLVVAIGSGACEAVLKKEQNTPLLCTFLPRSAYEGLIARHPLKEPASEGGQRTAIYFDQPLTRYMALIRILLPKAEHLGTAVGPLSKQLLPAIRTLSQQQGLTLHSVEIDLDDNPVSALSAIVEKSDVFLVNADGASLNKAVANWLLRLSIRQRIPVIAYSRNYVSAGALAAVYSSPENIGRDTGESVSRWLNDTEQPLELPRYTTYFTVSSNPRVARALGIKLPKDEQLEQEIREQLSTSNERIEP